jgi:hypothetical protein
MASAGITALLKKMDYKDVIIAIDGSLFRYYNMIHKYQYRITVLVDFCRGKKYFSFLTFVSAYFIFVPERFA